MVIIACCVASPIRQLLVHIYASIARRPGTSPRPSSIAQSHHVPEAGGRSGDGLPDERRPGRRRRAERGVLPGAGSGRGDGGVRDAGAGAAGGVVDGAVRLLRRLQQLLRHVHVPLRHLRADRGDHRPRVDVVRGERRALRAHHVPHGVPVRLLLLLPRQDARALRPPGEPLRRLLHPLVLRAMRALPGVPRAQEERLRHEPRMARQHGEARAHPGDHATPHAPRDDPLIAPLFSSPVYPCVCVLEESMKSGVFAVSVPTCRFLYNTVYVMLLETYLNFEVVMIICALKVTICGVHYIDRIFFYSVLNSGLCQPAAVLQISYNGAIADYYRTFVHI